MVLNEAIGVAAMMVEVSGTSGVHGMVRNCQFGFGHMRGMAANQGNNT